MDLPAVKKGGSCWNIAGFLLLLAAIISCSDGQRCKKFSDIPQHETTFTCDRTCVNFQDFKTKDVKGTKIYSETSDVCVAGVHAGVVAEGIGGQVTFTRHPTHNGTKGTISNRVVSKSPSGPSAGFSFEEAEPVVSREDLAADVVMVHDSYYGNNLELSCLTDGTSRRLKNSDIRRWEYSPYNGARILRGTNIAHTFAYISANMRASRCLGRSAATDVLAVVSRPGQYYSAKSSTIRTSLGENVTIPVTKKSNSRSNEVYVRRLPDPWPYADDSTADTSLLITFPSVSLDDAGIYIVGNDYNPNTFYSAKRTTEAYGAYFNLIVRECASGRFGRGCQQWCPDCENGGVCHTATGSCICPPGYHGHTCQQACDAGTFGHECGLQCSKDTLGYDPPVDRCKGLTICLPEPYGCSCAPGYHGSLCLQECADGQYGADCELRCDYCVDQKCDPVTGSCHQGCSSDAPCDGSGLPLDLPRLRVPPSISQATQSSARVSFPAWTSEHHDGSGGFTITEYEVQLRRETSDSWITKFSLSPSSVSSTNTKRITGLRAGYQYEVRVLVHTQDGVANGTTNKRVQTATFNTPCHGSDIDLTDLTASNITNHSALLTWDAAHPLCNLTYKVTVRAGHDARGRIVLEESISNQSFHITNLMPDTAYHVTITVLPSQDQFPLSFTTLPNAPGVPEVTMDSATSKSVLLSWTLPPDSSRADKYDIKYKLIQHKACEDKEPEPQERGMQSTSATAEIDQLESYAEYQVCVQAFNQGGYSQPDCENVQTEPDVPAVEVTTLDCKASSYSASCDVQVSGDCKQYNGPNTEVALHVQTFIACSNSLKEINKTNANFRSSITFPLGSSLTAGQMYNATVCVQNQAGPGQTRTTHFRTPEKRPPAVMNLTAVTLSYDKVRLQWNDPCPPNGVVTSQGYKEKSWYSWQDVGASPCMQLKNFDRCVEIGELQPNHKYTYVVYTRNSAGWTPSLEVDVTTKETKPGRPSHVTVGRGAKSLNVTVHLPENPGGRLLNCTLVMRSKQREYPMPLSSPEALPPPVMVSGLSPSKLYEVESFCCNAVGCGDRLVSAVSTLLLPPQLRGGLALLDVTDNSMTVSLPTLVVEGDASSSISVLVQRVNGSGVDSIHTNFTSEFLRIRASANRSHSHLREERAAPENQCPQSEDTYIAAVFSGESKAMESFVVGDGGGWGGHHNCPLTTHDNYTVAVVAEARLQDEVRYSEVWLGQVVEVVAGEEIMWVKVVLPVLFLLLLILVLIGLVHRFRNRLPGTLGSVSSTLNGRARFGHARHAKKKKDSSIPLPSIHTTPPTPQQLPEVNKDRRSMPGYQAPPPPSSGTQQLPEVNQDGRSLPGYEAPSPPTLGTQQSPEAVGGEPVYENVVIEEGIYENLTRSVTQEQLEGYLNVMIGSQDARQEFTSVDANVGESMSDGEQPYNKKKNRYRNNLPYNTTRVKLSVTSPDAPLGSDYINANHVYGFGGVLKYIAAQGPKDANVPTIGDFWRMVMEQRVTAIIMVANFVEGGKVKVGEYLRMGDSLVVDDYTVEVVKTNYGSHFNISLVQVTRGEFVHSLTHYQYIAWPDHGVPDEAHTMAAMLRHVISAHEEGTVVAHCSAGIGRTGTVLMVLLLHEMLSVQGQVDPFAVLKRLRQCRARLVENVAQYNFGLQIFDELMFGSVTNVPSEILHEQLEELLGQSEAQFHRASTLPSNLTFHASKQPELASLNRDPAVLPADSRRLFLNMKSGDPTSQYINAVRLDDLNQPNKMLATEHPMSTTMDRFWRLVVEWQCTSIVLINSYDGYEEEFPSVMGEGEGEVKTGAIIIRTLNLATHDSLLIYTLEVFEGQNYEDRQTVTVYQILSWPCGEEVPSNPSVLLGVADMLIPAHQHPDAGPILLSCWNGVTGCGVMAGVVLMMEQLQQYQMVDVYRIMVLLKRTRPQFITSQTQCALLYRLAALHLSDHETYFNLPV